MAVITGIRGVTTIPAITIIRGITGGRITTDTAITAVGEPRVRAFKAMIEIKQARHAGLYADGGLAMGSAMKPSINKKAIHKTWLGIGIVTAAMLLASSAATSPVVAAPAEPAPSRFGASADAGVHRQARAMRPLRSSAAAPHYYGRPTNYAPAYPPGPFVLFTPFFD